MRFTLVSVWTIAAGLRHANSLIYAAVGIFLVAMLLGDTLRRNVRPSPDLKLLLSAYATIALFAMLVTLFQHSHIEAIQGISRLLFIGPFFWALILYSSDRERLVINSRILVATFVITALVSFLLLKGGIDVTWLPEGANARGGLERPYTLLGSAAVFGESFGTYMLLAVVLFNKLRIPIVTVLVVLGILDPSKITVASVALFALALLILRTGFLTLRRIGIFTALLIGFELWSGGLVSNRWELASQALNFGGSRTASMTGDASDRLTSYGPATLEHMLEASANLGILYGGGFAYGSSRFVPTAPDLPPMAHSSLFEALSIFGVPITIFAIGVFVLSLMRLRKQQLAEVPSIYRNLLGALAFALFMQVTLSIGTGVPLTPAVTAPLALALYAAWQGPYLPSRTCLNHFRRKIDFTRLT